MFGPVRTTKLAALLVAAIAALTGAAARAADVPGDRTKIVFWNLFTAGDSLRVVTDLVNRFNERQPTYFVEQVDIPYSHIHTKILPAVAGNVPPDVSIFDRFLVASFAGRGAFRPLIVPWFFGNAFFIFLLRHFFITIPEELLEAARLDGASEWRVFWQIVLPLSKPALLTVMIFSVLRAWNDFLGPLIYLTSEKNRTIALGLAHLRGVQVTEWGLMMAAALLMVLPAPLLFFVAQRFFIEGIALTGTKA